MRSHREQVVGAPGGARELLVLRLVLPHDAAVRAQADVAPHGASAVVLVRDVGIKADQAREAASPAARLADDLLVVDPLEELAREGNARRLAAPLGLIQEGVRDELEPLLDELIVDLALPLDLFGSLELRGEPGLELPEAHVMEPRRIDVVTGDPAPGAAAQLDRPVDGPAGGF